MHRYYRSLSVQDIPRGRLGTLGFILGVCFHLAGTAFPYWKLTGGYHEGLWETCYQGHCSSYLNDLIMSTWTWLRAVQAMAILGVIVSLFGVIANVVFLRTGNKSLLTAGSIAALGSGILILIGVIIYAAYNPSNLFWAFYFEVAAAVVILVSGGGLFSQLCQRDSHSAM